MSFNLNLLKNIEEIDFNIETRTKLQIHGIYTIWDLQCETVESLEKIGIKTKQIIDVLNGFELALQTNDTFSKILKGLSKSGVSYLKFLNDRYFEKDSKAFEVIKNLTKRYFDFKIHKNFEDKKTFGINARNREDKIADEIETYERILIDKQEKLSCSAGPVDRLKMKIRGVNARFHYTQSNFNPLVNREEIINE